MKRTYITPLAVLFIAMLTSCGSNAGSGDTAKGSSTAAASGADIYQQKCASCHLASGEGVANVFPPLAKSDFLQDKGKTILQVIKGYSGELVVNGKTYNNTMPAQQLDDIEVAAVLDYVYSSFGNSGGKVTAAEVKAVRAKM